VLGLSIRSVRTTRSRQEGTNGNISHGDSDTVDTAVQESVEEGEKRVKERNPSGAGCSAGRWLRLQLVCWCGLPSLAKLTGMGAKMAVRCGFGGGANNSSRDGVLRS
jgi:hypothetical protein